MPSARLCAQILPTGSQCRQFALRTRPWCQVHADSIQRQRAAHADQLIAKFAEMDMFEVAVTLFDTTFQLQHKHLPPLHAYAIFEAALRRIDQLAEKAWVAREQARIEVEKKSYSQPATLANSNKSNGLQSSPVK